MALRITEAELVEALRQVEETGDSDRSGSDMFLIAEQGYIRRNYATYFVTWLLTPSGERKLNGVPETNWAKV